MPNRNPYGDLYWAAVRKIARYLEMTPASLDQQVYVLADRANMPYHTALRVTRDRILAELRRG